MGMFSLDENLVEMSAEEIYRLLTEKQRKELFRMQLQKLVDSSGLRDSHSQEGSENICRPFKSY